MGLRDRREQRQEDRREFGRRGSATTYRMVEKVFAIGDDYWIEDDAGQRCFKVNGKALRLRDTLILEDADGNALAKIQSRAISVRDRTKIEREGGTGGELIKDLVNLVRNRYTLKLDDGRELELTGNFLDHEYEIREGRDKVAEVSKKWFRVRDTYGVQIQPGYDDVLILAATAALDQSSRDVG